MRTCECAGWSPRVEREQEDARAEHREEVHRAAEEEDEDRDHAGLHGGAAQAEQPLQRVGAVDRERRERGRRVVDLVERPEHRPAVQRAVHQVLRQVVAEEVAEREARHHEPAGERERGIRPPAHQRVQPCEERRGDRHPAHQPGRDRHHQCLVDSEHLVVGPGRGRPPDRARKTSRRPAAAPARRFHPAAPSIATQAMASAAAR